MPFLDPDLAADETLVFALAVIVHQIVFLLDERDEIELHRRRTQSWVARVSGVVQQLGRLDQVLRGQAPAVHARAAQRALLGHDHRLPQFLRAQGGGESRGAGAQDDQVETLCGGHGHRLGCSAREA